MISVIVPVYNVDNYLARCIDSILAQTYQDYELILVDDGSTDESGIICDRYAAEDRRIAVIHKENGGVADARNFGLDRARGEYLCFVDSDDYVGAQYLEVMLDMITEYDANVAAISFQYIYTSETVTVESEDRRVLLTGGKDVFKSFFSSGLVWGCPGKLFKRDVFLEIRFLKGMIYEDIYTMPYLLDSCERCVYSTARLYYYYQHEYSATHTISIRQAEMLFVCMDKMLDYTETHYKELRNKIYLNYARAVYWQVIEPSLNNSNYVEITDQVQNKMRRLFHQKSWISELTFKEKIKIGLYMANPRLFHGIKQIMKLNRSV